MFARITLVLICLLGCSLAADDEPGKVTSTQTYLRVSGTMNGQPHGFLGMCSLEIDEKPAAAFGLYQAAGQKPQYTYLLLFKPNPKAERGSGAGGDGTSQNDSDGNVTCDLAMHAFVGGREVKFRLQMERSPDKVTKHVLSIGGQDYDQDGPRVFLVDLAAENPTPVPVKYTPAAVPSFDDKAWGQQILAAKKELIEKSPEAKKFFEN